MGEITTKVNEIDDLSDDDITATAIDLFLEQGFIKQDLDSYSNLPRSSPETRLSRKSVINPAIDTGLEDIDKETTKLKQFMDAVINDGTEVDHQFVSAVRRLTNNITILQNDHYKGEIDDTEFVNQMTKIENEVTRIDNTLGIPKKVSKLVFGDEPTRRATAISSIAERLTRINRVANESNQSIRPTTAQKSVKDRKDLLEFSETNETDMENFDQLKSILEHAEPEKHKSTESLRETVGAVLNTLGEFKNESILQTPGGVELKQGLDSLRKELTKANRKPVKSVRKSLAKCRDFIEKIEEFKQNIEVPSELSSITQSDTDFIKPIKTIQKEDQRFLVRSSFDELDENAPKIARTILR